MVKLVWTANRPPTQGVCSYDHCIAETPFGRFLLTWKSWKTDWQHNLGFDETPWDEVVYHHNCNSLEEAKQWAADELEKRLKLLLGEQEQPLPQPVLAALQAAADLNTWDEPRWMNSSQAIVSEAQLAAIKAASRVASVALGNQEPPKRPLRPIPLLQLVDIVREKVWLGQDGNGHEFAMIPPSVWRSVKNNVNELDALYREVPQKQHSICDECETVAHCTANGCIPKQPQ